MNRKARLVLVLWIISFIILTLISTILLSACASKPVEITPRMRSALAAYADQYDVWHPNAEENIAKICVDATMIFGKKEYRAIACALPDRPGAYGVITFDGVENVLDVFSVQADSDGELTRAMQSDGWK